ncbi:MAG: (2Fe-2S)-binding protein [Thermoanaerobaculia bacterium]
MLFCPVGMEEDDREGLKTLHPAIRGLKTVCRCNNVKYKTLERVIREGAKTIAQVAAKTTATTGYCGGSCTPYIQQVIDEIHGTTAPAAPKPAAEGEEKPWWER